MPSSTGVIFIFVSALEATFIIVGNSFAIFVFWRKIHHQKASYYLLINLAVADLLVGIAEPIVLATEKIPRMNTEREPNRSSQNPSSALQLLASSASVLFLALVAVERVYAVTWPFRHRLTTTRVYIVSIVFVWVVGLCVAGLSVLSIYHTKVERGPVIGTIHIFLFVSLLVITLSYLKIRKRLRPTSPEVTIHNIRSSEHNLRLSRTVFVVIAVSLVFWVPAFVVYIIRGFCQRCFSPSVVRVVNILHLANSVVNPFVYSFKMPIFKDALNRLWRKCRQNVEIAPVSVNRMALSPEGFATPQTEYTNHTSPMLSSHDRGRNGGSQPHVCQGLNGKNK